MDKKELIIKEFAPFELSDTDMQMPSIKLKF